MDATHGAEPPLAPAFHRRDGLVIEVPALWPLEVANALAVLTRRRKLTEDERQTGLGWLRGLPIRIDHEMAPLAWA
ncbi:MAG: type II toxin-antitoxin system VapC family toxin [Acidobacteria bacterium]|nr:type II toxin-antitoxin system VapC family toxin [Acidobacteriota bacterium]